MDDVPKKLAALEARYKDAEMLRLNLEATTPELMEKKRDEVLAVIRG